MPRFDPKTTTLANYRPPIFAVNCPRCNRHAEIDRATMLRRHGDITLHAVAQKIASAGACALATGDDPICAATAFEVPVEHWADLNDAFRGGWAGRLRCQRHMAAMKPTKPCPGFLDFDVKTLIALLGGDFKLERLRSRCRCWQCDTKHVELEWWVPDDPTPPGGAEQRTAQVLRLKPSRLRLAQERFRSIEGGRS